MVVDFPIHQVAALVVTAGDHTAARDIQGVQVAVSPVGILNAHPPGGAVFILGSRGADVAAHADQQSGGGILCRPLGGPALGDGTHIQSHLRIGEEDGGSRFVNDKIGKIHMLRRFGKLPAVRQIGVGHVIQAVVPGLVPQYQHTAHGHIHQASGELVVFPAVKQQVDDGPIHHNGGNSRLIVDGFQIVEPVVVIVDVEELMVGKQLVMDGLGGGHMGRLAFRPAHNGGDRVEKGQEGGRVLLSFRLPMACAAGQQQGTQQ